MKLLIYLGYFLHRTKGSHHIFRHPHRPSITVPMHDSRNLAVGTLAGIVRHQLEMTGEEFEKHLKESK